MPVAVEFDGNGKGGVVVKDRERVLLLKVPEKDGVNIVNETSVKVWLPMLSEILVRVPFNERGTGGVLDEIALRV